jgi:glyoxylase-like metal-dependent hydrolase (beta-lactamase superfamily II)
MFEDRRRTMDLIPVAPDIWKFPNERFYGERVGCYVVRDENEIVMIDTPTYSRESFEMVNRFGLPIRLYLTHAAASVDGDRWQKEAAVVLHLNQRDKSDRWLRANPGAFFDGDFKITNHIRAIHLPNHSAGHTVYYDDRNGGTLFSGDGILFHRGIIELDITESSKLKLSHLRFQRLLPFHYDSIGQDADTTVMRALRGL